MANVTLDRVAKHYDDVVAVREVSVDVADGELVVFVGPSGCGKSTTLRMIAGLEEITSGTIRIGDRVVNELAPRQRNIAMVFQNFALYPHLSVFENLAFGLRLAKLPTSEIESRVRDAADVLGLSELLERHPSQLSGGERQRVAMGRAIVRKPDAFLFDEPLSNLDAKLRTEMRTEIKRLHKSLESTIVFVTHDQVEAMTLADRIVILRSGVVEQIGEPEEIFQGPANVFVAQFIGSPPMNLFDASVDEGHLRVGDSVSLPLPRHLRNKVSAGDQVVVGLRSDGLFPRDHGLEPKERWTFDGRVNIAEPQGSETLLFVDFGPHEVVSKMINPMPVREGDELAFEVDLAQLKLFDRASGRAL